VDYILSEKTELALANSGARQIPLGSVDQTKLPPEVRALMPYMADGYPLGGLSKVRLECLTWLKGIYGIDPGK